MDAIEIRGVPQLLAKLGRIEKVHDVIEPDMRWALGEAEKRTNYTQNQPPRLPNQRYIRTFTLRSGWQNHIDKTSDGITARRYNNRTPYGMWVMGHGTQTALFRGRWPTDKSITDDLRGPVTERIERTIQRELDR